MQWYLPVCLLILSVTISVGQTSGSVPITDSTNFQISLGYQHGPDEKKSRAEKQQEADQFRRWLQNTSGQGRSNRMIRTIPIVIHLLEDVPSISDEDVINAVASLNNAYTHSQKYPNGGDFSVGTRGVDTQIEFCLAQRAPDGGVTNGIVRWETDYARMDIDLEDAKLKTQGQWDPRRYLNIWVVSSGLDNESDQDYTGSIGWERDSGIGGYSAGPGGVVPYEARQDGVIVTGLGTALVAHEIGHYLDLAHTFSGSCLNDDCLVDGDRICDTPPDISPAGCDQNTCDTDTLSNYSNGAFTTDVPDMTSNFMDYSSCPNEFTQGQADRMHFILDNFRIDLPVEGPTGNEACNKPCNADFTVAFDVDERYREPNVLYNFTSTALGTTVIDSYEWYVERLGSPGFDYPIAWPEGYTTSTPAVATTPDLQYSFPEAGKFRVYLKAWNSADPNCYTSYSRTIRVTCLGIDARFTPNVRFIAAKQPRGKMIDSVFFMNRSVNATSYEWTVRHEPYDDMVPAQPDFFSTEVDLNHTFLEPGDYFITLIAKNGAACADTCGPFRLPVDDPTIDAAIEINQVDCYREDSIRVAFRVWNTGYDTVRVGMPVTFYDEDPRNATPAPTVLGTYYLDRVVFGRDRHEDFVAIVPASKPKLDQIWAVINTLGTESTPIVWPTPDGNVMSVNSEFPPTGANELDYENNFAFRDDFQFRATLEMDEAIACQFTEVQLEADHRNGRDLNNIEWLPTTGLSCTNCLDPFLSVQDVDLAQTVVLTSEYFCTDTVSLNIPVFDEAIPPPTITDPAPFCRQEEALDVTSYVSGQNLSWYETSNGTNGSSDAPTMPINTPGTFNHWVSQSVSGCEGPRANFSYTVTEIPPSPTVSTIPDFCAGDTPPDLAAFVTGPNVRWYDRESGGTGSAQAPILSAGEAGTYQYWVSRAGTNCESERVELSVTINPIPEAPAISALPDLCVGNEAPNLEEIAIGNDLRWYSQETGGMGSASIPEVSTEVAGTYRLWVSQANGSCEGPRAEVSYTVTPISALPQIVTDLPDICVGDQVPELAAAVTGTNLQWYSEPEGGIGTDRVPTTDADSAQVYSFWVSQSENSCESPRVEIGFAVNAIPPTPLLEALPELCVGDAPLSIEDFVVGEGLRWYTTPNAETGTLNSPTIVTDSARTYSYWVNQNVAGCAGPRIPLSLQVSALEVAAGSPYEVVEGNSQEIGIEVITYPETERYSVEWLDEMGAIAGTNNDTITITPAAPTFFTAFVEAGACTAQVDIEVDFIYIIDPAQIFSPNGDGLNDRWHIGDIEQYPNADISVYNRWGSLVYGAKQYQNDWMGTWQDGEPLPVATYYYVIDLNRPGIDIVTGSVTIVR